MANKVLVQVSGKALPKPKLIADNDNLAVKANEIFKKGNRDAILKIDKELRESAKAMGRVVVR